MPTLPRLPLVGDPLRRIRVPSDLDAVTSVGVEADPADAGMTRDQVEAMWRSARRLYRSGVHPALQLCVRRDGHVVLDRAIGHATGNGPGDGRDATRVPVTTQTPYVIFSASKAITAMVIHLLDQRGLLHIGDRVADYIPEYARHDKTAITIAHVLSHRAGVPNLPGSVMDLENLADEALLLQTLCDARPASRAGKTLAYHAISGGFILGEIVKRVTGDDIRTVLGREILDPLGFRFMNYGVDEADLGLVGRCYATGAPVLPPVSTLLERALGKPPDAVVQASNDPRFLRGIIPAGNVVASANELSRYFELLRAGGTLDGVELFEPRTILRARSEQSYREIDFTLGFPTRYGLGFMLGAELLSLFGPKTEEAFGHLGYTNTIGWADPARGTAAALVTSGKPVLYPELPDLWALMRRVGLETARA
jgi:CubicO group peptidase (beta-lactamase class C family)